MPIAMATATAASIAMIAVLHSPGCEVGFVDNKVECIYTENVDDFKNYDFLKAVNPFK